MNTFLQRHARIYAVVVALSLITFAWFLPQFSRAQTEEVAAPLGTVDCFEYYKFGSVQVDVTPNVTSTVSGVPLTFTGTISNGNPYPIVDGALYVKVFRLSDESGERSPNGPDVVDQFFVRDGIALPAHSRFPITFSWDVPSYAMTGEYQLATFFTSSKKFNLLGLSFTDDVVGNVANFNIAGERAEGVWFDKDAVSVAGEDHYFAAFVPEVDTAAPVEVTAEVKNTTGEIAHVPVSWTLYAWDGGRLENIIAEDSETVTIPAGGSTRVSFTAEDARHPVYLLVGTMQWGNTQSVINVRFARSGMDKTRINFPSVMAFPLQSGASNTLFSCLHNTGDSAVVSGGRLELKLADESGNTIHEYVYTGDVTSAMMGVADVFTPNRSYNVAVLSARLYQDNTLVDETELRYDCREIDPASCLLDGDGLSFGFGKNGGLLTIIGLFLLALIVLAVGGWIVRGSRSHSELPNIPGLAGLRPDGTEIPKTDNTDPR